jgi:hypothetical protein
MSDYLMRHETERRRTVRGGSKMVELETRNSRSLANKRFSARMALTIVAAIMVLAVEKRGHAQSTGAPYPKMAAIDQYLMTEDVEVALARSAAPQSISKDADVLVLDRHGYRTAIKGRNGFVCAVQRSWTAGLDDPDFWNPRLRAPICFNPPAARSYLPRIVKRTKLALAGKTKGQLSAEMKAAFEAKEIPTIEPGAMGYMLNLPGSPIFGSSDQTDRVSVFFIPVRKWSDGSSDSSRSGSH